ncbi:MAG: DUF296 domain-containing protein [Rhodobacteraceae bacterium]|nr:DUF296 domain-containing protein [Paracoccaceae bacterium]
MTPRALSHPGPRAGARFTALPCHAQPVDLRLAAGVPFDQAVIRAFADAGFTAGYLKIGPAAFAHLSYVIPAPAPGDRRAAWYSRTYTMRNATVTEAGLHIGTKDGAAFLHCHGLWSEGGGPVRMGHLLSPESVLRDDITAQGWGLTGAALQVTHDPETGFDLFAPTPTATGPAETNALLCTLRPNEDPHALLVQAAAPLGDARIEGIGSLVTTQFDDDRLDSYATEVLVRSGRVAGDVTIDAASVGFDGDPKTGRLKPHGNRICITAELLLIAD